MNALRDPFRADLSSESEEDKDPMTAEEALIEKRMREQAERNCEKIMASVVNKQKRNL